MTKDEIQARIAELRGLIEKANRDYYDLHQPTVGDRDYDLWEAELLRLEKENPEFATDDSPVRNVAGGVSEGFAKVTHEPPMQSLDKTHSKEELADFDAMVRGLVGHDGGDAVATQTFTYLVEPKVDGVSLSLRYENGILVRALSSLRHELGADDVPIVLGELGEYLAKNKEKERVDKPEAEKLPRFRYWKEINALTSSAAKELGNATVVSAKGLTPNRDILHFDTASLREFGHRYAKAMKELQNRGAK